MKGLAFILLLGFIFFCVMLTYDQEEWWTSKRYLEYFFTHYEEKKL